MTNDIEEPLPPKMRYYGYICPCCSGFKDKRTKKHWRRENLKLKEIIRHYDRDTEDPRISKENLS